MSIKYDAVENFKSFDNINRIVDAGFFGTKQCCNR